MSTRSSFALLLHEEGDVERATSLFSDALAINETMFADGRGWPYRWVESAAIHALYGRHEEALIWLQRAFQAGHFESRLIAQDRMFASLRDDLRFQSILTQMAEAQAAQRTRVEAEGIAVDLDAMIAAIAPIRWKPQARGFSTLRHTGGAIAAFVSRPMEAVELQSPPSNAAAPPSRL